MLISAFFHLGFHRYLHQFFCHELERESFYAHTCTETMLVPGALGTAIHSGRFMLLSLLARRKGCGWGMVSVRALSRLWGAYFGDSTKGTGKSGEQRVERYDLFLGTLCVGFSANVRYPNIVKLLISDTSVNLYCCMQVFYTKTVGQLHNISPFVELTQCA